MEKISIPAPPPARSRGRRARPAWRPAALAAAPGTTSSTRAVPARAARSDTFSGRRAPPLPDTAAARSARASTTSANASGSLRELGATKIAALAAHHAVPNIIPTGWSVGASVNHLGLNITTSFHEGRKKRLDRIHLSGQKSPKRSKLGFNKICNSIARLRWTVRRRQLQAPVDRHPVVQLPATS